LADLVGSLQELHGAGCDLFLHQQAIDTTTPAGKAMFQMLGVLSEFERSMIQARVVKAETVQAADGYRSGHPDEDIEAAMQFAEAAGWRCRKSRGHAWGRLLCPIVNAMVVRSLYGPRRLTRISHAVVSKPAQGDGAVAC
jgi:hypothetical protein